MKIPATVGLIGGIFLLLSSPAHAFIGWPALENLLASANFDAGTIAAIAVGWYFGSVAMATFGIIACDISWRWLRGQSPATLPMAVISGAYLAFGLTAYILRDLNPHFLLFVLTGLLVGVLPLACKRARDNVD